MAEKLNNSEYKSSYDGEVKQTYEELKNRPAFRYEAASDPAYRAYRDRYRREGELAMRNSIAETADLSGGYANSYAQRLGQQQYGAYLEKLSDVMPRLYGEAWQRYKDESEALEKRLDAAGGLADSEYRRWADAAERDMDKAQLDYKKQQDAYKNLAEAIAGSGYLPTEAELAQSGMSRELAAALSHEFLRRNGLLPAAAPAAGGEINYYDLSPYYGEAGEDWDNTIDREAIKIKANKK